MAQKHRMLVSVALFGLMSLPLNVAALGGQSSGLGSTTCPGDCDGSFAVEITDLTVAVNIVLGRSPLSDCISTDTDTDGRLSIAELVRAVVFALEGCPCVGDFANFTCGGTCPAGAACAPSTDLGECSCISAAQPCGETAAECNGECLPGTVCRPLQDYPLPGCGCVPEGTEPCDGTIGQCGGSCPDGTTCAGFAVSLFSGCVCLSPSYCAPCASSGFYCGVLPPEGDRICVPQFCGGDPVYPTCGGSCSAGTTCQPATLAGSFPVCVCARADAPCDAMCGGVACPPGNVCNVGSNGCGCEPL